MAIRIDKGTYPPLGRITSPVGTFLSNPSTAADGMNQGGAGTLPPTPQINMWQGVTPGYNNQLNPNTIYSNSGNPLVNYQGGGQTVNPFRSYQYRPPGFIENGNQFPTVPGGPRPGGPTAPITTTSPGNIIRGFLGVQQNPEENRNVPSVLDRTSPALSPTNVFKSPTTNSPSNSLVGSQILNNPLQVSTRQLNQIMPGLTAKELYETMSIRGYVRTYRAGVGEVWVMGAEAGTTAPIASGRPESVNGASLERGERATNQSGFTYIGGTPYTNADGETVGQYAVTYPKINEGARAEKHGSRYKWVSTVVQDKDGNWVRVNKQVLRKVFTRSHQKKAAARREQESKNNKNLAEFNQLVTLRADYG